MLLSAFSFSIMGAFIKYSVATVPFMEAVFFRCAVMVVLLLPWMFVKKIPLLPKRKDIMFIRVCSGFTALCLNFYAVSKINLSDIAILNQTSVIFVAALSALFLKEKVGTLLAFYIFLALVGVALIIKPGFTIVNVAGLLGLASGLLAAIAYVSVRFLHATENYFTMVFDFAFFGSLASLLLGGSSFFMPKTPQIIALIIAGLFGTLGQLTLTKAYKYAPASIVSPFSYFTVICSLAWGIIFWLEIPDFFSGLGTFLIILCGVGILRMRKTWAPTQEIS